ncbi:MAG: hypothetical protein U1E76_23080 [Planctomycetota bacterium]
MQTLESVLIAGRDAHVSVQRKAIEIGTATLLDRRLGWQLNDGWRTRARPFPNRPGAQHGPHAPCPRHGPLAVLKLRSGQLDEMLERRCTKDGPRALELGRTFVLRKPLPSPAPESMVAGVEDGQPVDRDDEADA